MFALKKKDVMILSHLRRHARIPLTELSRKSGIPVSTLFDKLKTATPFVKRFTILMDFLPLGFATRAIVVVKVHKKDREDVKTFVAKNKSINSVYKVNNGYDYCLDIVVRDMKELEDLLQHMEEHWKIEKRLVFYLLEIVKEEEFLTSPDCVQMLFPDEMK